MDQHRFPLPKRKLARPASFPSPPLSMIAEAMWQMTLQSSEEMDLAAGPFPERIGEPDCLYYMRTGLCGYGMSCRYNHPRKRKAALLIKDKGEYPERSGQPECQYYLKTGTCKFGSTCKYHHPRERAGSLGRVIVNIAGLPLRLGEKDCAYYLRTGSCKFGVTCKFNHPQPEACGTLLAMSESSMYAPSASALGPLPQPFPASLTSWPIARSPYMPGSRFQVPSNLAPVIVPPQGMFSMTGWSPYQAQMGHMTSLEVQQQALGASFMYGRAAPTNAASGGVHTSFNPYVPGSSATGFLSTTPKDPGFPERPGLPECQYYLKTGDCKFGMSCRYDHPKERNSSMPNSILSPIGLPLRSGVPHCAFYTRYGACKFGPSCKFDHPMRGLTYSPSASSLADMPIAPYPVGSSFATLLPSAFETLALGPKSVLKESAEASDENGACENSYKDSHTDDIALNGLETASVNQSFSPNVTEPMGSSSDVAMNSSS